MEILCEREHDQQQPTKGNAGILFNTLVCYQHKYVDFILVGKVY